MAEPPVAVGRGVPELTVVIPTFDERGNIEAVSASVFANISVLVFESRP